MHILDLNDDVLGHILTYLDDDAWVNFRLAYKRIEYLPTCLEMDKRLMKYYYDSKRAKCRVCNKCLSCVEEPEYGFGYCGICCQIDICYDCAIKAQYRDIHKCNICGYEYCSGHMVMYSSKYMNKVINHGWICEECDEDHPHW